MIEKPTIAGPDLPAILLGGRRLSEKTADALRALRALARLRLDEAAARVEPLTVDALRGELGRAVLWVPPKVSVHALALRLARAQPWADPFARELYRSSDYVRTSSRAAEALRRAVTTAGDTPAAWDALSRAAREEVEARRVEHALDEGWA